MTFLLNCAIQVAIVLLIGLCWLPLLRKKSASLRHCVLSTALAFAALIPLFNLVMPVWNVSLVVSQHPAVAPLRERISAMTRPASEILMSGANASPLGRSNQDPLGRSNQETKRATPVARAAAPGPLYESSEVFRRLPWIVWSTGVFVGMIVLVTGLVRLARVGFASGPIPNGHWARLAGLISSEYSLKRAVVLLESRNPSILVTWGFIRPKVIVPAGAGEWPEERARIVLRHELAHIRRCDWILQMIAQALRIVYWFNPLIWIVCRRLRLESECACDDAVLSHGIEGHEYAGHLLDLARAPEPTRSGMVGGAHHGPPINHRKEIFSDA